MPTLDIGNKVTGGQIIELERLYGEARELSEKGFFLGIADYIKYIVETPSLELIAQTLRQLETKDGEKLEELEKKLKKEINEVATLIFQVIKNNNLDFPVLKKVVDEYDGLREGRILSTATLVEALHGGLANIVRILFEQGYKQEVAQFLIINNDTQKIAAYNIAPSYNEYSRELKNFRDKVEKSDWGSWNDLVNVYLVVHRYQEELAEMDPKKDLLKRLNFMGMHQEMQSILEMGKEKRIFFVMEDYKSYFSRVHNYFIKHTGAEELIETFKNVGENINKMVASFRLPEIFTGQLNEVIKGLPDITNLYRLTTTNIVEPINEAPTLINPTLISEKVGQQPWLRNISEVGSSSSVPTLLRTLIEITIENTQVNKQILATLKSAKSSDTESYTATASQVRPVFAIERKLMTKTEAEKNAAYIKKELKLIKFEAELIDFLADGERHKMDVIEGTIKTGSLKDVKRALVKKLKRLGYLIDSKRGGPNDRGWYQLVYPTNRKITTE